MVVGTLMTRVAKIGFTGQCLYARAGGEGFDQRVSK